MTGKEGRRKAAFLIPGWLDVELLKDLRARGFMEFLDMQNLFLKYHRVPLTILLQDVWYEYPFASFDFDASGRIYFLSGLTVGNQAVTIRTGLFLFDDDTCDASRIQGFTDEQPGVETVQGPIDGSKFTPKVHKCTDMPPLLPKCFYCHKEITREPYVVKQYPSISQRPPYHTRCFVIAHRGQLSDISEAEMLIAEPRSHNE